MSRLINLTINLNETTPSVLVALHTAIKEYRANDGWFGTVVEEEIWEQHQNALAEWITHHGYAEEL